MKNQSRPDLPHSLAPLLSRRKMLGISGLASLGLTLGHEPFVSLAQAAETRNPAKLAPLNRFPRMVQEFFVNEVRRIESASHAAKANLATSDQAQAHVRSVRNRIRECFGPDPEKTPLNAKTTGTVERDTYRIENIVFENRPGFLVTGNLYLPKGKAFPLPGVLGVCGHSVTGKAEPAYQSFSQGLARMGYVVFIIDPIGQGERLQYPGPDLKSRIGVGVREHLQAGNQQFLVGGFIGAWRAWDGIRALDYLLTRPEVDPKHIGVTGNSGGGTLTTWLCGLDSRWTMAAPSCFVTTFRRNLENELPADTEQCPPRALALGLDHEDFLAALAPKPILILGKEKDYFDARGTEHAFARLKKLYNLLGDEENIGLFQGPTHHGYTLENREAMYRWFNRITGISEARTEPELTLEDEKTLWCTPQGQVSELKSRTVFSFTAAESVRLRRVRPVLNNQDLMATAIRVLRIGSIAETPDYRILRALPSRAYPRPHATTYAVATEPGIYSLVIRLSDERHDSRPPQSGPEAQLYIAHQSSDAELREDPFLRTLIGDSPETEFFACDVRGIGESRPDTAGQNSFLDPYGSDYFYAIHSMMLDRPYAGQRTLDVLAVLKWLESFGHSKVHLAASGCGCVPATFAALLSPSVTRVTLKNPLPSYANLAESELYEWPLSSFIPNILANFDLPDCYEILRSKHLQLIQE